MHKAIVLFFQLAFDVSLNVPKITGSKLKTKIIFPDREFTNSVFLNCCCQALYIFLKCGRLEEVIGDTIKLPDHELDFPNIGS